jgi:exopolyphosphatase/guanosine-5'-triphosphate,3'-diphosphate pyrophosphatase
VKINPKSSLEIHKLAAIDIGSNAVRLLFTNVVVNNGKTEYKKSALIRMPVRLGEDAFTSHVISDRNVERLVRLMMAYKHLMLVNEVEAYRACATSAMREAHNGEEIVKKVLEETGIEIEIIDGKEEAKIIYSNQITDSVDTTKPYLYMDVGGGSTELSLFIDKKVKRSRSFDIGTIRLLNKQVPREKWNILEAWVNEIRTEFGSVDIIGSGGNINKINKMINRKDQVVIKPSQLKALFKKMSQLSYEQRIAELGLNLDRADVIIPAGELFLSVSGWIGAKNIIVPTIGVSDGIIKKLYKEIKKNKGDNLEKIKRLI